LFFGDHDKKMLTPISGFPEFLPCDQIAFNQVVDKMRAQFELHGFIPLDTPAVERTTTLLAKGNDSEIYAIHRLADPSAPTDSELALRFDLTVPLARYVAQHYGQLTFPYRRYHIAPVWRGERPQAGRYRQFYQCDIDIVGDGVLSLIYDAELLSIIYSVFKSLPLERFVIKINNRYLLTGLIKSFGMPDAAIAPIMRVIDKAAKIKPEALEAELQQKGLHADALQTIQTLLLQQTTQQRSNSDWIAHLNTLCTHPEFITGLSELTGLFKQLQDFGVSDQYLQIDPTLARGLNYYTGTVSETQLLDYPELGSVCGGGRYANLTASFSRKTLPGVGFSIGLSRLIPKLIETGVIPAQRQTPARVLITTQNQGLLQHYIDLANSLRAAQINTEIYLADKPLGVQMKYAHKKGFDFAIIADHAEYAAREVILRALQTGEQACLTLEAALETIRGSL
jgi:histidyl-tRNA synthetase